jgi:hypothetical protein
MNAHEARNEKPKKKLLPRVASRVLQNGSQFHQIGSHGSNGSNESNGSNWIKSCENQMDLQNRNIQHYIPVSVASKMVMVTGIAHCNYLNLFSKHKP